MLLCAWNREDHAHYTVVAIEFQNTNHILEQNALKFQEKFINANNIWCCSCALYFSFREYILKILYFNFACMFNYMAVFISCTFCTLWFDVLGLCPSILFALKVFFVCSFLFKWEQKKTAHFKRKKWNFTLRKNKRYMCNNNGCEMISANSRAWALAISTHDDFVHFCDCTRKI